MAYIHVRDDSFPLGSSSCGRNCPCASCKQGSVPLGEWYVREEADTLEPARTAGWTLSGLPHQNLPNLSYQRETAQSRGIGATTRELVVSRRPAAIGVTSVPGFGEAPVSVKRQPGLPPFKFVCDGNSCALPSGCASLEAVFRKRILGAIKLAHKAASKLDALDSYTKDKFRQVFGQSHSDFWEVPCCPMQRMRAANIVASRFRTVEKELQTRTTVYRCISAAACAQTSGRSREERPRHPTDIIVSDPAALAILCKDEVLLCPLFWQLKKEEWQEGTILHEMFHLCFGLTCAWFQHDQNEKPRNSAYCYEVFALLVTGKGPDQISIDKCKDVLSRNRNGT